MTLFGYIAPPVATVSLLIFGETVSPSIDPSGTLGLLSNTSAVGLLGWYLWYTQTRTIPKITNDHKEAVQLAASASASAIKEASIAHSEATKNATDMAAKVITNLSETFKQELATERNRHDKLVEMLQRQKE